MVFGETPKTATGTVALPVAERRGDNSPAFQCRVQSTKIASPGGTTGMFKMMTPEIMCHPFSRPCGTRAGDGRYPALKRRAIAGLSLWDGKQFDCLALADVWFVLAKLFWQAQSPNCEREKSYSGLRDCARLAVRDACRFRSDPRIPVYRLGEDYHSEPRHI